MNTLNYMGNRCWEWWIFSFLLGRLAEERKRWCSHHTCAPRTSGKGAGPSAWKICSSVLIPRDEVACRNPLGNNPQGKVAITNSSTFQETYETNSHTGQLHGDNRAGVFCWHKEYHLIRKAGVKGLFAHIWSWRDWFLFLLLLRNPCERQEVSPVY